MFVKQLFTFSALLMFVLTAFSSCDKQYTCSCDEKYIEKSSGNQLWETNSTRGITAKTKDDAKFQCRGYYETEQDYLNRWTVVQHYCSLND